MDRLNSISSCLLMLILAAAAKGATVMKSRAIAQVTGLALGFGILGMPVRAECQFQKLIASDAAKWDILGSSVSIRDDQLVAGAPNYQISADEFGAAYVFKREDGVWVEQALLAAADPQSFSGFGRSVSIDGDVIAVGASSAEGNDISSGAVYVYRLDGAQWNQEAKLSPGDAAGGDRFGVSVSISGDSIAIGAPGHDGGGLAGGAAYVFRFNGSTWIEEAQIWGSATGASDGFGLRLSIDGDGLAVTSLGEDAAYLFTRQGNEWTEDARLAPSGLDPEDEPSGISLDGDTVALGVIRNIPPPGTRGTPAVLTPDGFAEDSPGSVYVFTKVNMSWIEEVKLAPSEALPYSLFGLSVDIGGGRMAVGAPYDHSAAPTLPEGSAFLFEQTAQGWVERAKLPTGEADRSDYFGWSVAIDANVILIGAPNDDDGCINDPLCESGAVYVYKAPTCGVSVPAVTVAGLVVISALLVSTGALVIKRSHGGSWPPQLSLHGRRTQAFEIGEP